MTARHVLIGRLRAYAFELEFGPPALPEDRERARLLREAADVLELAGDGHAGGKKGHYAETENRKQRRN